MSDKLNQARQKEIEAQRLLDEASTLKNEAHIEEDATIVVIPLKDATGKVVLREVSMGAARALLDRPLNDVPTEGKDAKTSTPGKKPWIGKRIVRKLVMKRKE